SSVEPKTQETKVEKDPIENKKTEPVVPAAQEAKKEKEAVKTQTVDSTESNKAETVKPVQVEQNPVAPEVKKAEPVKEVKTTTAPKVEVDSKSQKPAVQTPVATSKNVESPKEDSNKFIKTDKSIKTTDNTSKPQTPVAKTEQGDPIIRAKAQRLAGPNIVGKIDLPVKSTRSKDTPVASSSNPGAANQNADNKR